MGEALSEGLDPHPRRAWVKQGSSPESGEHRHRRWIMVWDSRDPCMLGSLGEPESYRAGLGVCQRNQHLTERLEKLPQRTTAISMLTVSNLRLLEANAKILDEQL